MQEDKITPFIEWRTIVKKIESELSAEEEQGFSIWFDADRKHRIYYEQIRSAWNMEISMSLPDVEEMILLFEKATEDKEVSTPILVLDKCSNVSQNMQWMYRLLSVAAILACFLISFVYFFQKIQKNLQTDPIVKTLKEENVLPYFRDTDKAALILSNGTKILLDTLLNGEYSFEQDIYLQKNNNALIYSCANNQKSDRKNMIFIPRGGRYDLRLSDGSKVFINAETILMFPVDFSIQKRSIYLDGEAFFDVVASKLPFIVKTDKAEVKVYGTTFNVCAYSTEAVFTASLVSGSVGITRNDKECKLAPGQEAVIDQETESILIQNSNTYVSCSWLSETLIFENEPMEHIANKISRMYNVPIEFGDSTLRNLHFTGDFNKSRGLNSFFEIFESITHIRIQKNKDKIIIGKK